VTTSTVEGTQGALVRLGATPDLLSESDRRQLNDVGFLVMEDVLDGSQVEAIRARFDELVALEGDRAGTEVHQEAGTNRVSDLVNKGDVFDRCWTHPKQLAAIAHVLGGREMKLSSLNGRAALPGSGHQALHADWSKGVAPGDYYVCNSLWMLDDFTEDNGATRVVPGSHRWHQVPSEGMADPREAHPDEVVVTGRAGTVAVFNSHLWHGGGLNRTDRPRHALHSYFCRRDQPQQTPQRKYLRAETTNRISPAALYLLDVE
jgi:ectoine hydroxylase-related dioxygenase (phytanoyl-CoA dioxygenase family)